jgi:hypothetical protein
MLMFLPKATSPTLPGSHVIAACVATKNQHWGRYMSKYFLKQTVLDTWNHTIEGYLHLGTFTQDPKDSALYIPNPNPAMCQGVSRRKKKRIRNNKDEAEAGPQGQICSKQGFFYRPPRFYRRAAVGRYAAVYRGIPLDTARIQISNQNPLLPLVQTILNGIPRYK